MFQLLREVDRLFKKNNTIKHKCIFYCHFVQCFNKVNVILRMNPASEGFNHYQNELVKAKQEIEKLKERIKAMQEGISMNLTQVVDNRIETNSSQEVEG